MALHRRLAAEGAPWLAAGGALLIETSPDQAPLTAQAMSAAGLATEVIVDEEVGGCVVVGVRTGAAGRG